jgi:hypothetical protein
MRVRRTSDPPPGLTMTLEPLEEAVLACLG